MKKLLTLMCLLIGGVAAASAQDTWTVAGSSAALNGTTDWAPAEAANDMTSSDGTNYTLSVTDCTLEAGTTYKFKVVKNHAWDEAYPSSDKEFYVTETAVYTVDYGFNSDTKEVTVATTKTGEAAAITHTYNIAGNNATLFGAEWDATNTATDMTDADNDGIYTWESAEVGLTAGKVQFKVTVDHSWGTAYPSSNYELTIPSDGTYIVTITFNSTTNAVNATAAKKNTYTVTFVNGKWWPEVAAYAWSGDGASAVKVEGNWPGKLLSKTGTFEYDGVTYDVYTYTYEGYETIEKIIFNNNKAEDAADKEQTADLAMVDRTQYSLYYNVYAVSGISTELFANGWSTMNLILDRTADGYMYDWKTVELAPQTIELKVFQKETRAATDALGDDYWWPKAENVKITIPVAGRYGIRVMFNEDTKEVTTTLTKHSEKITIGDSGWATYVTNSGLYLESTSFKAYTATLNGSSVTLNEVQEVQAETGLVLKGTKGDYYVQTREGVTTDKGDLKGSSTEGFTIYSHFADSYYALVATTEGAKFAAISKPTTASETFTIPAGKAFLIVPYSSSPARELGVVFADEATGISNLNANDNLNGVYDLQGRRVAQPTKGLYIKNGKKVILK